MPSKTRTGLIALTVVAPFAAAATLFSNAPAQGGQLQLNPAFLMAQAETTEQDGMTGQGGMMGQGGMGGMGSMMNMMQQMSRMMETCNDMMEAHGQHEKTPGGAGEPESQQK